MVIWRGVDWCVTLQRRRPSRAMAWMAFPRNWESVRDWFPAERQESYPTGWCWLQSQWGLRQCDYSWHRTVEHELKAERAFPKVIIRLTSALWMTGEPCLFYWAGWDKMAVLVAVQTLVLPQAAVLSFHHGELGPPKPHQLWGLTRSARDQFRRKPQRIGWMTRRHLWNGR